ncbi:chromo domain containing protein [Niveomyces insectorum RCEF 264]|uniref:Chromo domain containing protein n=1 Tax=Niveomyces insectorum RCEF 264 TaxID=1081102 RepID=A0A162IEA5_9HYPO|nr:chromo domain containing protein [Niveomyces insectorum RCEF 264]
MAGTTGAAGGVIGCGSPFDPTPPPAARTTAADAPDEDDISVTSTFYASEDSETEYGVEDVLAQKTEGNGAMYYFVKWDGYPLEKCTWEPEDNMGSQLLDDLWVKKRTRVDYVPFDFDIWKKACEDKARRHARRNAKRKRLGLPLTEPFGSEDGEAAAAAAMAAMAAAAASVDEEPTIAPGVSSTRLSSGVAAPTNKASASANGLLPRIGNLDDDDVAVIESLSTPPKTKPKVVKKKPGGAAAAPLDRRSVSGASTPKTLPSSKQKGASGTSASKPASQGTAGVAGLPGKGKLAEKVGARGASSTSRSPSIGSTDDNGEPLRRPATQLKSAAVVPSNQATALRNKTGLSTTTTTTAAAAAATAGGGSVRSFSARKTGASSQKGLQKGGGNAFVAGEKIRTGNTLDAAMSDPTRQKQFFSGHRMRRLALLRDREKPEQAIDPAKLSAKLFPISQGPSTTLPTPAGTLGPSVITQTQQQTNTTPYSRPAASPAVPAIPSALAGSSTTGTPAPTQKPKRKKVVRFVVHDNNDDDSGADGGALFVEPNAPARAVMGRSGNPVGYRMKSPPPPLVTQSVVKGLLLGTQGEPMHVCFNGVPQEHPQTAILDAFLAEDAFRFSYTCLAETLVQQFTGIRRETLFSGSIVPAAAEDGVSRVAASLETAAAKLRMTASVLVLMRPAYGILVYFTQGDDGMGEQLGFPPYDGASTSASAPVLRYFVFSTYFDCGPFLRSPDGVVAPDLDVPDGTSEREHLMRVFFQLDRTTCFQLFPARSREPSAKRNLFLAFPPSATASMQQIVLWFQTVDPNCQVYYSAMAGAWLAFQNQIVTGSEAGAVVIHELLTPAVRCFPGLGRLLLTNKSDCTFWSMSQSILSPPDFPSDVPCYDDAEAVLKLSALPGQTRWTPLFPDGLAFLLTPSFLITEPQRTYDLLAWFRKIRLSSSGTRLALVAAWNLGDYLRGILEEKLQYRADTKADPRLTTKIERKRVAGQKGARQGQCELRYKVWLLFNDLCDGSGNGPISPSPYENGSPNSIVFVDEAVDANDEQSLVNWFGLWSTMHMDQYRSFYVVGSGSTSTRGSSEKSNRWIPVPNFSPDTLADPDFASDKMFGAVVTVGDAEAQSAANSSPPPSAVVQGAAPASSSATRSQRYPDDSVPAFTAQLMSYNTNVEFWRVYGHAVAWKDADEAFRFGSLDARNHTIKDWFAFTWPFTINRINYRSYIGFFYTVDGACDSVDTRRGPKLPRHPWVVIYRPVHPHQRPFKKTELIFWDPRVKDKYSGQNLVRERDLTASQQAVVEYVRQHGEKEKKLGLQRAWISGEPFRRGYGGSRRRGSTAPSTTDNELDLTMEYLDVLTADLKTVLPPTEYHLDARGFREVLLAGDARENDVRRDRASVGSGGGGGGGGGSPMDVDRGDKQQQNGGSSTRSGTNSVADDTEAGDRRMRRDDDDRKHDYGEGYGDDNDDDGDEEARIKRSAAVRVVFHPPCGYQPVHKASKCRNLLFDRVRAVRGHGAQRVAETMAIDYPPTVEWYRAQQEEGRAYEHVHVDNWEAFFLRFKVGPAEGV